jgi:hypothetical protein
LAEAIIRVLEDPEQYYRTRPQIEEAFSLDRTVTGYETLFRALITGQVEEGRTEGGRETGNTDGGH